jgi:hypothetical protein
LLQSWIACAATMTAIARRNSIPVSSAVDGEYPEWPEQKMLAWLPANICRQFGKMESSVLNGPFLSLDVRRTPEIHGA